MSEQQDTGLDEGTIHGVLSNDRRRHVLELLRCEGPLTVRELSERVAARETGEDPPPRDARRSVYVSLQQTHLDRLAELGAVRFDEDQGAVCLDDRANDLHVYMEVVPRLGVAWAEVFALLGLFGALLVVASRVGVPVIRAASPWLVGACALGAITVVAVYRAIADGRSLLNRL